LCGGCGLLNHSRWPKVANVCLGCSISKTPREKLVKAPREAVKADPLIDWVERPQVEDVLTWGWSDIADFCFVLAYASGAADGLEREAFTHALRQLNLTAREWLKKGSDESDEVVDSALQRVYVWLVRFIAFLFLCFFFFCV
jgi:hypothetical protein